MIIPYSLMHVLNHEEREYHSLTYTNLHRKNLRHSPVKRNPTGRSHSDVCLLQMQSLKQKSNPFVYLQSVPNVIDIIQMIYLQHITTFYETNDKNIIMKTNHLV